MKTNTLKVLHFEESPQDTERVRQVLNNASIEHEIFRVDSDSDFIHTLHRQNPDIILSSHSPIGFGARHALRYLKDNNVDTPFIVFAGFGGDNLALDLMNEGADEFLHKASIRLLPCVMQRTLLQQQLASERNRAKTLNRELRFAYNAIQNQNQNLISGITSARRIMKAMLPGSMAFENIHTPAFVLHQPKDIIGGDFYFVNKVQDGFVVAAADSTGHGVSGALISMVGYHLIKDVVSVKGIFRPDEVLQELDDMIKDSLNKMEGEQITDGMDISVCYVNTVRRQVEFAGANQSLYFISGDQLQEVKGDKKYVGDNQTLQTRGFSRQSIPYQKGDRFYLASDGFQDQFSGTTGKRLMKRGFRELLFQSASLKMQDQHRFLENFLENWKGNEEQTDDVLLMGIEL